MKKIKLLIAFITSLVLMILAIVTVIISNLLNCLPEPWNFVANGAMFLALTTLFVYLFFPKNLK